MAHSRFKVFINVVSERPDYYAAAEAFVRDNNVTARSLGVEFLEDKGVLLVSLGYSPEPGPPVKIHEVAIGRFAFDGLVIETALEEAAAKVEGIICHEFYVTKAGDVVAVFMTQG